jgi:predicted RNA-binding Zn-ribbon protein involved in translation (DUF1610 family)
MMFLRSAAHATDEACIGCRANRIVAAHATQFEMPNCRKQKMSSITLIMCISTLTR